MIQKPSKIQPALVGGLLIGLLWSLPFLNLINMCCCVGVLAGGAVAALMLIKRSPMLPVSTGDGAVVGLLAGVVGAGVHLVLGVPISIIFNPAGLSVLKSIFDQINDPQIRAAMDEALRSQENQGMAERLVGALLGWFIVSLISIGFSTLGGLIGVAMFEKRKGQRPPYPPAAPNYGGPGFAPPGPPPGGPQPPGQAPYGQGPPPNY